MAESQKYGYLMGFGENKSWFCSLTNGACKKVAWKKIQEGNHYKFVRHGKPACKSCDISRERETQKLQDT